MCVFTIKSDSMANLLILASNVMLWCEYFFQDFLNTCQSGHNKCRQQTRTVDLLIEFIANIEMKWESGCYMFNVRESHDSMCAHWHRWNDPMNWTIWLLTLKYLRWPLMISVFWAKKKHNFHMCTLLTFHVSIKWLCAFDSISFRWLFIIYNIRAQFMWHCVSVCVCCVCVRKYDESEIWNVNNEQAPSYCFCPVVRTRRMCTNNSARIAIVWKSSSVLRKCTKEG